MRTRHKFFLTGFFRQSIIWVLPCELGFAEVVMSIFMPTLDLHPDGGEFDGVGKLLLA
ncbi:MAG TPA: hypothetical protein V6D33_14735 [Cyanophyceae cyanobacterium]